MEEDSFKDEEDQEEEETDEGEEPEITVEEDKKETTEEKSEEKSEEKTEEKTVDSFNREMSKAVCADCGKNCEVPFTPTAGRPVYCRDCYKKHMPQRRRY